MNYFLRKSQRGYAILFSIIVTGIVLSLVLGMANIAFRQGIFSKEAKDSSKSFFAADTGLDCITAWDLKGVFDTLPGNANIQCLESSGEFTVSAQNNGDGSVTYSSTPVQASSDESTCMIVRITKNIFAFNDENGQPVYATNLTSIGYNKNCSTTQEILSSNTQKNLLVERRLSNTYTSGN